MSIAATIARLWKRSRSSESSDPLVSIVIPSFNHGRYIREAVRSVIDQSYTKWELIIIDDGSTDDSWDFLTTLVDRRVTVMRQDNCGAHATINKGFSLCRGDFLTVLNSDDAFHSTRLERCLAAFRRDPGPDLIATWIEIVDQNDTVLGTKRAWHNCEPWPLVSPGDSFAVTDDFRANLLQTNFVSTTSNIFLHRRVYEGIGGMRNLRYAHDWDFLLRAALSFRCEVLPEALVRYRVHSANTIKTGRAEMLLEICTLMAIFMPAYAAAMLPLTPERPEVEAFVSRMRSSFNFQGNDDLFRALVMLLQTPRYRSNFGAALVNDNELKRRLALHVRE